MRMYVRVLASTGVVLALGVCLLAVTRTGTAADSDEAEKKAKAAAESVLKLADALEKGDAKAVDAEKANLKKMELLPIMTGFKKRDADPVGGIGFGKPKAYDMTPTASKPRLWASPKRNCRRRPWASRPRTSNWPLTLPSPSPRARPTSAP
jgi:hypothetical protein